MSRWEFIKRWGLGTAMQAEHPERVLKIDSSMTPPQLHAKGLKMVRDAAANGSQEALLFVVKNGGI